eukprot:c12_g1_i1.p1 GENE.c12_g1_i1~~c12_g1_i1.p1  ORF type:complete len:1043 (-),score=208.99 c12_g1_i1:382-3426(-)
MCEAECDFVNPLRVYHGTFRVSLNHITFVEHNQHQQQENQFGGSGDGNSNNKGDAHTRKKKRFLVSDVHKIHFRRYLLRRTAMELFLADGTNYFFNFPKKDRRRVFMKIRSASQMLGKGNTISLESVRPPAELFKMFRNDVTERWQNRQISNFEYLMFLNTIAGRSYNDITQYPVFPWVIQDYTSTSLDLDNPETFRNLKLPIGALNDARLKTILDRYNQFEDPDGIIPKFHYGTHYSSAAVVLYYLLRMEPFTTAAVELQGGTFDHADRLFESIQGSWTNVMSNPADVKELIPEFFYCPEFLVNSNGFNLGIKQNGTRINDCLLPAWCKTPYEFVKLNRDALESEHVSMHLNYWIDLIFGYKQRGDEAIKAHNMFYYLTYENAVDIDKVEDPQVRHALERQIENFGQTPSQLLIRPHPKRKSLDTLMLSIFGRVKISSAHRTHTAWVRLYGDKKFDGWIDSGVCITPTSFADSNFSVTCRVRTNVDGCIFYKCLTASSTRADEIACCLFIKDGKVCFLVESLANANKTSVLLCGLTSITDSHWHSIALICDNQRKTITLYVGGIDDGNASVRIVSVENNAPIHVGKGCLIHHSSDKDQIGSFNGYIHELIFHAKRLNKVQVQEIATQFLMNNLYTPLPYTDAEHSPQIGNSGNNDSDFSQSPRMASDVTTSPSSRFRIPQHPLAPVNQQLLFVAATHERIITVDLQRTLALHKWSPVPQTLSGLPFSFEADPLIRSRRKIGAPLAPSRSLGQLFALAPDGRYLISAGHWDNSFRVTNCETGRLMCNVYQHKDVVSCVALTMKGCVLVTGSKDTTLMVWVDERGIGASALDRPRSILYGHANEVCSVAADAGQDLVVSGSLDGTCILYSLSRGRYVRTIHHPNNCPVHLVALASTGEVLMFSEADLHIHMFTINGEHICQADATEKLNAMTVTGTADFLLTAGEKGVLVIRELHSLTVVHKLPTTIDCPITCLDITPEEHHVLVGLANGTLCTFSLLPSESRKQSIISSLELIV